MMKWNKFSLFFKFRPLRRSLDPLKIKHCIKVVKHLTVKNRDNKRGLFFKSVILYDSNFRNIHKKESLSITVIFSIVKIKKMRFKQMKQ